MFFATFLDLGNLLDGLNSLLPGVAAVFDWHVATLFELETWIDGQFLASSFAMCLCPCYLTWVLLALERLVTLSTTEFEDLR